MDNLVSLVIVVVIIVIAVLVRIAQGQALDKAKKAYRESLAALSADPTNTSLRQSTLALGRTYSNLTRNRRGVTLFDEVVLAREAEALKLPEEDRARLFSSLLLSFEESSQDAEIAQAWAEEAARRDQTMESGEEPGIPAEEVFRRLRSLPR